MCKKCALDAAAATSTPAFTAEFDDKTGASEAEFRARIALFEADDSNARRLAWFTDAELRAELDNRAALPPSPAEEAVRLLDLLAEDTDDVPCRYDHHGACQEHGGGSEEPGACSDRDAHELLKRLGIRAALASPAPAAQGEEACTKRTSSAHEDEVTYECGRPATVEALTTSGQWEPHCAPHVAGWPSDRVRSR